MLILSGSPYLTNIYSIFYEYFNPICKYIKYWRYVSSYASTCMTLVLVLETHKTFIETFDPN